MSTKKARYFHFRGKGLPHDQAADRAKLTSTDVRSQYRREYDKMAADEPAEEAALDARPWSQEVAALPLHLRNLWASQHPIIHDQRGGYDSPWAFFYAGLEHTDAQGKPYDPPSRDTLESILADIYQGDLKAGITRLDGTTKKLTEAVPERSSLVLFGSGALGLVGVVRRRLRAPRSV